MQLWGLARRVVHCQQAGTAQHYYELYYMDITMPPLRPVCPGVCCQTLSSSPISVTYQPTSWYMVVHVKTPLCRPGPAGASSPSVPPLHGDHPFRPETREHPHLILLPLLRKSHRLGLLLLCFRQTVIIRVVTLVSRAGGYPGGSVCPQD